MILRNSIKRENAPPEETLTMMLLLETKRKSRRNPKDVEPDLLLPRTTQTDAWVIQDCGGSGDCAFRAIARALAQIQKKDIPKEKIAAEAAQLRVLAVGRVKADPDFKEQWVPDPHETPDLRCGQEEPIKTFEEYISLAAKKMGFCFRPLPKNSTRTWLFSNGITSKVSGSAISFWGERTTLMVPSRLFVLF